MFVSSPCGTSSLRIVLIGGALRRERHHGSPWSPLRGPTDCDSPEKHPGTSLRTACISTGTSGLVALMMKRPKPKAGALSMPAHAPRDRRPLPERTARSAARCTAVLSRGATCRRVCGDVRLVQRRRVQHGAHAPQAAGEEVAILDRSHVTRMRRGQYVHRAAGAMIIGAKLLPPRSWL